MASNEEPLVVVKQMIFRGFWFNSIGSSIVSEFARIGDCWSQWNIRKLYQFFVRPALVNEIPKFRERPISSPLDQNTCRQQFETYEFRTRCLDAEVPNFFPIFFRFSTEEFLVARVSK